MSPFIFIGAILAAIIGLVLVFSKSTRRYSLWAFAGSALMFAMAFYLPWYGDHVAAVTAQNNKPSVIEPAPGIKLLKFYDEGAWRYAQVAPDYVLPSAPAKAAP